MNILTASMIVIVLPFLTACNSFGGGTRTAQAPLPDFKEFEKDPAGLTKEFMGKLPLVDQYNQLLLIKGESVEFEVGGTGFTMQCARQARQLFIHPKHSTGVFGVQNSAVAAVAVDENCDVTYGGLAQAPAILFSQVVSVEGLGRLILGIGGNVVASYFNGGYAATQLNCGGKGCGGGTGTVVQNVLSSTAGSYAGAQIEASMEGNGCAAGNCGSGL